MKKGWKKDAKKMRKNNAKTKKMAWTLFFHSLFMYYWINVGSRGRQMNIILLDQEGIELITGFWKNKQAATFKTTYQESAG